MEGGCKCVSPGGCPWHKAVTDQESFEACREGNPPDPGNPPPCLLLGKLSDKKKRGVDQPVYECHLHGHCSLGLNQGRIRSCADCSDYILEGDPHLPDKFVDPLVVTDRNCKKTTALRNMLNGGAAFLVCGGPSLKSMPYERLAERGVFSLGINNVCGWAPVSAFCCSDPPMKFHHGIFLDPNMMKFLPKPKLTGQRAKIRRKNPDGAFEYIEARTNTAPNCWGFERRSWMSPDATWFTETSAGWGNHNEGVNRLGEEKTVNTMFLGLRLLQYLGAKKIFLLGVDFHMDPELDRYSNYSFGEERDPGAVGSNNNQYRVAMKWFERLRPVFESFGFYTYNCNPQSSLRAFDYVPFDVAMQVCKGQVPDEPFDLLGWYAKVEKHEGKKNDPKESSGV